MSTSDHSRHLDIEIGRRVRRERRAAGETQAGLGAAVGVTAQQIQRYEAGINRLPASLLFGIAHHLGCRVANLLGYSVSDPDSDSLLEADIRAIIDAFLLLEGAEMRWMALEIVRAMVPDPADAARRRRFAERRH